MLGAAVAEFYLGAHGFEELALGLDVAHLGDVLESDLVFSEDGGGHAGERGVFCAGDLDCAEEGIAATDDEFVHGSSVRNGEEGKRYRSRCGAWLVWGTRCPGGDAVCVAAGVTTPCFCVKVFDSGNLGLDFDVGSRRLRIAGLKDKHSGSQCIAAQPGRGLMSEKGTGRSWCASACVRFAVELTRAAGWCRRSGRGGRGRGAWL